MSRGGDQIRAAERRVLRLLHDRSARRFVRGIHAHILRRHLHRSNLLLSHLIDTCSSLRLPSSYSLLLFLHSNPNPNLLLFNSTIKSLSLSPSPSLSSRSLLLFSLLKSRGLSPDRLTFAPLLKSSSRLLHPRVGESLHSQLIASGFHSHSPIQVQLVEFYAKFSQMENARRVFDEMIHREVIVWNLMIDGFCRSGDLETGFRFFRRATERNVVTWNSMINGCARACRDQDAVDLFDQMCDFGGLEPDDATLVTVLPVCARLGSPELGRRIHDFALRNGFLKSAVNVSNALVDMYCKLGDMETARSVFDTMARKNVVSWNAMIVGSAFNDRGSVGLDLFEEMKRSSVKPNEGTFVGALGCCTHAGLVDKGKELFRSMADEYGIEPKIEHYGCLVDLLGRCGLVREATEVIGGMPMRPNPAIWGALLSACRNYGDLDVAELAAKELVELEPDNSGNYVLLANLYAEMGRWDDVEKVRLLMKGRSVRKAAGQSAVELDGG